MSNWIRCSDRLPKKGWESDLLEFLVTIETANERFVTSCYFCNGDVDDLPYAIWDGKVSSSNGPFWYSTYMDYDLELYEVLENVIAWMPKVLPEPFEG